MATPITSFTPFELKELSIEYQLRKTPEAFMIYNLPLSSGVHLYAVDIASSHHMATTANIPADEDLILAVEEGDHDIERYEFLRSVVNSMARDATVSKEVMKLMEHDIKAQGLSDVVGTNVPFDKKLIAIAMNRIMKKFAEPVQGALPPQFVLAKRTENRSTTYDYQINLWTPLRGDGSYKSETTLYMRSGKDEEYTHFGYLLRMLEENTVNSTLVPLCHPSQPAEIGDFGADSEGYSSDRSDDSDMSKISSGTGVPAAVTVAQQSSNGQTLVVRSVNRVKPDSAKSSKSRNPCPTHLANDEQHRSSPHAQQAEVAKQEEEGGYTLKHVPWLYKILLADTKERDTWHHLKGMKSFLTMLARLKADKSTFPSREPTVAIIHKLDHDVLAPAIKLEREKYKFGSRAECAYKDMMKKEGWTDKEIGRPFIEALGEYVAKPKLLSKW